MRALLDGKISKDGLLLSGEWGGVAKLIHHVLHFSFIFPQDSCSNTRFMWGVETEANGKWSRRICAVRIWAMWSFWLPVADCLFVFSYLRCFCNVGRGCICGMFTMFYLLSVSKALWMRHSCIEDYPLPVWSMRLLHPRLLVGDFFVKASCSTENLLIFYAAFAS